MNLFIVLILLTTSYLAVNQAVTVEVRDYRTRLVASIVVLMMFLCGASVVGLLYLNSGYDWFIIYAALLVASACVLGLYLWRLVKNWRFIDKKYFALLVAYSALILWVTIVMRIGGEEYVNVRSAPLDRVIHAFQTGNWKLFQHFLLNLGMFLPFGFLLKMIDTDRSNGWGNSLLLGVLSSTVIETLQMLLRIGEWDIDDIIANTLGTVVGFLVAMFLVAVGKNWTMRSDR